MIRQIRIENYKSIHKLKLNLGRFNVLIGENGSGKTNILEAIALSSAASNDKLDNEFLAARGIRVTDPIFMRAAFDKKNAEKEIIIGFEGDNGVSFKFLLQNDNASYSEWTNTLVSHAYFSAGLDALGKRIAKLEKRLFSRPEELINGPERQELLYEFEKIRDSYENDPFIQELFRLKEFLIYSPENPYLRTFEKEGQIRPLGIHGQGLFKLLKVLTDENQEKLNEIKEKLRLTDWFEDFEVPGNLYEGERYIGIRNRYMDELLGYPDQKSAYSNQNLWKARSLSGCPKRF